MGIIQVHLLRSFCNSFINGDSDGHNKRCYIGGVLRHRWSSQSQKFRLRKLLREEFDKTPPTVRSFKAIKEYILDPLIEDFQIEKEFAEHASGAVARLLSQTPQGVLAETNKMLKEIKSIESKCKAKTGSIDSAEMPLPWKITSRKFIRAYGEPELFYALKKAKVLALAAQRENHIQPIYIKLRKYCKDKEFMQNWRAMGAGFEAALCGRVVPGDIEARVEGAISLQHAFTTHEAESTFDFFGLFDDLSNRTYIQEIPNELCNGVFYQYGCLDLDTLIKNLSLDKKLAAKVAVSFIDKFAQLPAAALTRTAPSTRAQVVLVEYGKAKDAYTFAEAFEKPSAPTLESAGHRLATHISHVQDTYRRDLSRAWYSSSLPMDIFDQVGFKKKSFPDLLGTLKIVLQREENI